MVKWKRKPKECTSIAIDSTSEKSRNSKFTNWPNIKWSAGKALVWTYCGEMQQSEPTALQVHICWWHPEVWATNTCTQQSTTSTTISSSERWLSNANEVSQDKKPPFKTQCNGTISNRDSLPAPAPNQFRKHSNHLQPSKTPASHLFSLFRTENVGLQSELCNCVQTPKGDTLLPSDFTWWHYMQLRPSMLWNQSSLNQLAPLERPPRSLWRRKRASMTNLPHHLCRTQLTSFACKLDKLNQNHHCKFHQPWQPHNTCQASRSNHPNEGVSMLYASRLWWNTLMSLSASPAPWKWSSWNALNPNWKQWSNSRCWTPPNERNQPLKSLRNVSTAQGKNCSCKQQPQNDRNASGKSATDSHYKMTHGQTGFHWATKHQRIRNGNAPSTTPIIKKLLTAPCDRNGNFIHLTDRRGHRNEFKFPWMSCWRATVHWSNFGCFQKKKGLSEHWSIQKKMRHWKFNEQTTSANSKRSWKIPEKQNARTASEEVSQFV